jgi:hypothetical protein
MKLSSRALLVAAWLGLVLYAYPGYMSADSVLQLVQARTGVFGLGHPPLMGVLWAICDAIVTGPIGMLVIQTTCFVAGVYLLMRPRMSERTAATCTLVISWFPPIAAVLAVIWKDSQMTGFLALGIALLASDRRRARIGGLALLSLATAMRYNALAITFVPVLLLFTWSPRHRWHTRYPLAFAAWLAITIVPAVASNLLVSEPADLWHDSVALFDLTGTLRYAPDLPDARVREQLAGTPLLVTEGIQEATRTPPAPGEIPATTRLSFGTGSYTPALWATKTRMFAPPANDTQRAAITAAWKRVVLGHPGAYLEYRWHVFAELIHLGDDHIPSGVYSSFTDSLDRSGSAARIGHNAVSSRLQRALHTFMGWIASSWLFRPWIYLALALGALPLCVRDRRLLAIALSGIANEAVLFVVAPTVDFRYSIWLVVSAMLVVAALVARAISRGRAARDMRHS